MTRAGVAAATNYPAGCWGPPDVRLSDQVLDLRLMLAPLETLPELRLAVPSDELVELPETVDVTLELQLEPDAPHLSFADQLLRLLRHHVCQPGVFFRREQYAALAALSAQARRRLPDVRRPPA